MKLNKLNVKELKKLFASAGLVLTLGLTGCATEKTETPVNPETPTTEVEEEIVTMANGQKVVNLSDEESKTFVEGDVIEQIDGVYNVPDAEILENNGLMMVYELEIKQTFEGAEKLIYTTASINKELTSELLAPTEVYETKNEMLIHGKIYVVKYTQYSVPVSEDEIVAKKGYFDELDGKRLNIVDTFLNENNIDQEKFNADIEKNIKK